MSVMLIFIAASAAIVPAVYAELFPTSIRTIGVGVPYSICVAVFGGTAPYLQTVARHHRPMRQLFNVYAVAAAAGQRAVRLHHPGDEGQGPHALIRSRPG